MARRMEIELTSARDDGTYTWRAAGAKQPRGIVDASLVEGHRVGDVLRVEAEIELDGISIVSILTPRQRHDQPERIELKTAAPTVGAVTTSLVERRGKQRRSFLDEGDRTARRDRPARPRSSDAGEASTARPARERRAAPAREGARSGPGEAGETRRPGARPERPRPDQQTARPARPARPRPPRLVPKDEHMAALLGTLAPEQRPVAEQLAAGGLPAVRRALSEEQAAAKAAGRPPVGGDAIIAMAEQLVQAVREAAWLDRAEAAVAMLDQISLRDLRASVAGAAPRDDHGRELLARLRAALDERLTKLRANWEQEIAKALEEKRVLHALRLSARPPEPSARFPAKLVENLAQAASEALAPTVAMDRWLALLEAALASPVRRLIKPVGIPEDPTGAARQAATLAAGRIPALSKLLGLAMPPPPRPVPRPPARPPLGRTPSQQGPGATSEEETPASSPSREQAPDLAEAPGPPSSARASEDERATAHPSEVEPAEQGPTEPESTVTPADLTREAEGTSEDEPQDEQADQPDAAAVSEQGAS